ncbi:DUF3310 domain-containing protein [Staphylococcus pseudintermedius]|uniref:DUF3310 domain-containing protein n=1 Tax=Staphylococcus pseudintermedius TaxID=283734 RepID=UPI001933A302|nr:DUF3310 domain-containing protein [Staphylococcus pseudintermedius]EGQ3294294.1 DUF3310 domain-containing protein [Staphylococcus pseudintermedius]EGQ3835936.1 DUF3310 domain-containing protein [Staphylococcus pseudintermedius]EGQ4134031.1 DUF3310 domain-containing protein [Staphylococcus pseudintermedius]EGQ4284714.1 DUF3310 domain-containing protein [Staphylococcus pseudintermedius]EHK9622995.1 DUF3310 domain-containing protein [Staphylococcus pseudintermedius]
MEIKDLKIGDKVQIVRGVQRVRDEDDEKWVYEPCFENGEVIDVYEKGSKAQVDFKNGTCTVINANTEWYKVPSNTKIATHDRPAHYGDSNKDLIDYWCERYSPEELRGAFKSQMSKYVDRLGYKDDQVKELNKIIDYATRYKNHLEKVKV